MRVINNILHIKYSTLSLIGVEENTLKRGLFRQRKGLVKCWEHLKIEGTTYINYEKLGNKYKAIIEKEYGDVYKYIAQQETKNKTVENIAREERLLDLQHARTDVLDYQYYTLEAGLKNTKANDLMESAGWMKLLHDYRTRTQTRRIGFETKKELRESVLDILIDQKLYGLRVSNVRILSNKEKDWKTALIPTEIDLNNYSKHELNKTLNQRALNTLINKQVGNSNRRIIGKPKSEEGLFEGRFDLKEFHCATILNLYMNYGGGNKLDNEEIHKEYVRRCEEKGKNPVTLSAIKHFLQQPEITDFTTWERDGYASYDALLPHVHRKQIEYSFSKGGMDGFQVDFYTTANLKGTKTRIMLTVVAVMDLSTDCITGYDIGVNESGYMVRNALKNHFLTNNGRAYHELESDLGSSFSAKETQELISKVSTYKTAGAPIQDITGKHKSNPKKRRMERLIQELNRLTQRVDGWKGTNITSIDKSRKPNADYLSAQESLVHGVQQVIDLIGAYNNIKLEKYNNKSREEELESRVHPEINIFTEEMIARSFNKKTTTTVYADYIKITVNKVNYEYLFADADKYKVELGTKKKVNVYYNEGDMKTVHLFGIKDEENDFFLTSIGLMPKAQGAKIEQTGSDLQIIEQTGKRKQAKQEKDLNKILEVVASANDVLLPSGATLEEKRAIINGVRLRQDFIDPFEVRYEEELSTPKAKQKREYYEQELVRKKNLRVVREDTTSADAQREFLKKRYS